MTEEASLPTALTSFFSGKFSTRLTLFYSYLSFNYENFYILNLIASIWVLQFHSLPFQPSVWGWEHRVSSNGTALLLHHSLSRRLNRIPLTPIRRFLLRAAINNSLGSEEDQPARNEVVDSSKHTLVVHSKDPIATFQKSVTSSPPVVFLVSFCYLYSI
ncbi:hypothetical protein REPUB_Repub19eG0001800 [Reevesia pubescens]